MIEISQQSKRSLHVFPLQQATLHVACEVTEQGRISGLFLTNIKGSSFCVYQQLLGSKVLDNRFLSFMAFTLRLKAAIVIAEQVKNRPRSFLRRTLVFHQ